MVSSRVIGCHQMTKAIGKWISELWGKEDLKEWKGESYSKVTKLGS